MSDLLAQARETREFLVATYGEDVINHDQIKRVCKWAVEANLLATAELLDLVDRDAWSKLIEAYLARK
ncbi:hypothetical protein [Methylobacterium sp. ID0610]|uniref:hypothetical protein n=1 Tax=Methylobacterium carpenticola TaxID=3344827 RepID=UPI0036944D20